MKDRTAARIPEALAIQGGPKVRTRPWPKVGRRFGKAELKELREALAQNTLFYHYGKKTKTLCARMAEMAGARYALAYSSGSAALHAAVIVVHLQGNPADIIPIATLCRRKRVPLIED